MTPVTLKICFWSQGMIVNFQMLLAIYDQLYDICVIFHFLNFRWTEKWKWWGHILITIIEYVSVLICLFWSGAIDRNEMRITLIIHVYFSRLIFYLISLAQLKTVISKLTPRDQYVLQSQSCRYMIHMGRLLKIFIILGCQEYAECVAMHMNTLSYVKHHCTLAWKMVVNHLGCRAMFGDNHEYKIEHITEMYRLTPLYRAVCSNMKEQVGDLYKKKTFRYWVCPHGIHTNSGVPGLSISQRRSKTPSN